MSDESDGKKDASRDQPPPASPPGQQPVWTFRGYQLRPSEFTTAMVHFFRAEVSRANIWRQRLDTTTNWAVVTTGAVISFSFTTSGSTHLVILLNAILVTMFLSIEARRYRYYELWSYRVRLMETDFFASMLVPPFHPSPDWAEALAENLLHPSFSISAWEAIGRRLRRNYLWIYMVIGLAWLGKIWLQPEQADTWAEFVRNAAIAQIPGEVVIAGGFLFGLVLIILSLATLGLQQSAGEVLPRYGAFTEGLMGAMSGARAWFRPAHQRQQLLTFVITDKPEPVSNRILSDMNRGCTALTGTGMFTGDTHSILMIALTVTEIPQLRALVAAEDPRAFVIVSPAQEVFGGGFKPLQET